LRDLTPRVELNLGRGPLADCELTFSSIDNFEPGNVYRRKELVGPGWGEEKRAL